MDVVVGEKVIITGKFVDTQVDVVEDITPMGFIKVHNILFNADGTQRCVSRLNGLRIEKVTPEKIQEIEERLIINKAVRTCRNITTRDIDVTTANKLLALLQR